jgi:hypothetical protein
MREAGEDQHDQGEEGRDGMENKNRREGSTGANGQGEVSIVVGSDDNSYEKVSTTAPS